MSDRDALLNTILAAPDDDQPRLVFSDWLDEHGECDRAELIRIGLQLATYPKQFNPNDQSTNWKAKQLLKDRQQWLAQSCDGVGLIHMELRNAIGQGPILNYLGYGSDGIVYTVERGFVSSILCSAADWLAHADAIVATQPVREVFLTKDLDWFCPSLSGTVVLVAGTNVQRTCKNAVEYDWVGSPRGTVLNYILRTEWPDIRCFGPNSWRYQATFSIQDQDNSIS